MAGRGLWIFPLRLGENFMRTRFFQFRSMGVEASFRGWIGCTGGGRLGSAGNAYAPYSNSMWVRPSWRRMGDFPRLQRREHFLRSHQLCGARGHRLRLSLPGHGSFWPVAVVADTGVPISPCGACRQVLAEFGVPVSGDPCQPGGAAGVSIGGTSAQSLCRDSRPCSVRCSTWNMVWIFRA
jgi:hypothetical protein